MDNHDHGRVSAETLYDEARSALERVHDLFCSFSKDVTEQKPRTLQRISPFLLQFVYQAASVLIRLGLGDPAEKNQRQINDHKELLRMISPRWRLAG